MSLSRTIKQAREEAGLTLTEAAERLGIGKSTLSRLETGKGPVSATRLAELAGVYRVAAGALLDCAVERVSSEPNYQLIEEVIVAVESVAQDMDQHPIPKRVGRAAVEVLRLAKEEADRDARTSFDHSRYNGVIKAMLGD